MKYDLEFKLSVIEYYEQGHSGSMTAKQFDIDEKDVSKWICQFRQKGIEGIRPRTGKTIYSADFKHHVLTVMKNERLSLSATALKFNISSPSLISIWRKQYDKHGIVGLTAKPKGRKSVSKNKTNPYIVDKPDDKKTLAELKRELEYLRAENTYLKKLDALLAEDKKQGKQG